MDYSARWYSPNYGRFITEDTFLGWMEEPLSLNRYSYVSNNPVNYIDPTGHIPEEVGGGWSDYTGDTEEEEEEIYYVRDVNLYVNGLFEEMVDLMSDNHTYFKGTDTRVREYYESRGYIVEWEEEKGVLAWSSIEERNRNLANEAGDMPDDEGTGEDEKIANYTKEELMNFSEKHYARNQLNVLPSDNLDFYQNSDKWFHEKKDIYHKIGIDSNTEVYKFVALEPDENGMYKEAVFHDGKLVIMEENSPNAHFENVIKDSVNAGTINYATSKSDAWKHYEMDVRPYYKYDNDSISLEKRSKRLENKVKNFGNAFEKLNF